MTYNVFSGTLNPTHSLTSIVMILFDKILVQYINIRKLIHLRLLYIILSTAEKYEIALP